jgi:muramoyltetrapeptide carboxypeptidase
MKRKQFLSSLLPLTVSIKTVSQNLELNEDVPLRIPPYLKKNDVIALISPAGTITEEEIGPASKKLDEWDFRVKIGSTIGKKDFTFGGTDEERLADLQAMLDDRGVKAIMSARGGYGLVRIIDKIDFRKFIKHPKWIIGFSDITVMHSHINRHYNIATLHSKMCNSFPEDWNAAEPQQTDSINSIRRCLEGEKMNYQLPANPKNRTGKTYGPLIGGNLKTLENLSGTNSSVQTRGKILFVEDAGEYLYSIDRMFWNLKRSGKLEHLKGLVVGGFRPRQDDAGEEFGRSVEDIVLEKVKDYNFPVCFDFPVGHQKHNVALKCGVKHHLSISESSVRLEED